MSKGIQHGVKTSVLCLTGPWRGWKPGVVPQRSVAHICKFLSWLFIRTLQQLLSMTSSSSTSLSNATFSQAISRYRSCCSPVSIQDCTSSARLGPRLSDLGYTERGLGRPPEYSRGSSRWLGPGRQGMQKGEK